MEKYKFFYGGVFSNWYPSEFTINGFTYNCMEQYMMHQKAVGFNDFETARKIMKTKSPKEQKALGREVKNFDSKEWDDVKYDVVKRGVYEKFQQDFYLKEELLKYKGRIFCETSPNDRIWGIGFDFKNAIQNKKNWGENLLGKILTEVSQELI